MHTQALSLGACHLGDRSGLHWSTERHARTPQASVLLALIFARGASIFCSKRAVCLSCASPSSAHRSQPCSCPCIGSCTSRHHTCSVNGWPCRARGRQRPRNANGAESHKSKHIVRSAVTSSARLARWRGAKPTSATVKCLPQVCYAADDTPLYSCIINILYYNLYSCV